MKNSSWSWSRVLTFGCAVGLMFLAAGDSGRTQVVTAAIGIDPLQILDVQIKPNVLIVLDTSGSMREPPLSPTGGTPIFFHLGGDDPIAKMFQAKDALNQVLTTNAGKFNFGFATYGLKNADKNIAEPAFTDSNNPSGSAGPLTYVSADANADAWTGGGTDYFVANTNSITAGTASQNAYNSFRPFKEVYSGPGCGPGVNCRRYLFSRVLRNDVVLRFDTGAGAAGLQPGFPSTFTCPKPPAGLFPQDPNVDATPATSDLQRPCFRLESTAGGNPGATFFYTANTWEFKNSGQQCSASAVLENVSACTAANIPTIKGFLKPEMPVDGSCGDTAGVPCRMTPWLNNLAGGENTPTGFDNSNPSSVQGGNPNTEYGVTSAQNTPLGGVLNDIGANFGTYFPAAVTGQRHFVLLVTDGDEGCGGNPSGEALTNYNRNPRIETLVVGFGNNFTGLNAIAQAGSGNKLNAFTATNTQDLVNNINAALQQTIITGEFSDQQSITESVFEFGGTAGIDPRDPAARYTQLVPLLLQSTFEMPGFVGHLNAFRNNSGTALQVWDAGDMLCRRVTGFPATPAGQVPAKCDESATSVDTSALGVRTNLYQFSQLIPANSGPPNYSPSAGRLKRRIFTTSRNGVFAYGTGGGPGSQQQPSNGGPTVPLWPPSTSDPGVDPNKSGSSYPGGVLDNAFGIGAVDIGNGTMNFAALQTTFGACDSSTDTVTPPTTNYPPDNDCTVSSRQTGLARKEAREMILAYEAGAEVLRGTDGKPKRNSNNEILYRSRTWILGDATLSGPALVTPPLENKPTLGVGEYDLYRDGPRSATGTPLSGPGNQVDLGFGLRNPDKDPNPATTGASKANVALKPVMSIVYYGANDMLHAFRAGPQCAVVGTTTCAAGFETGGEELWGFVPFDQLGKLTKILLQGQDRANHKYLVATAVRFGDVFIPATFNDPNGVARTGRWRTLLFVGRGIGGNHYTALDVTSPGEFTRASLNTKAPLAVWNRGNPDTQDGTAAGTANSATSPTGDDGISDATAYATMGQTWSVPALGRVRPANNFNRDFILYAGSGYGAASSGQGRSFYSIDPVTGDILTQADVGSGTGSVIADNAVVANPAVFIAKQLSAGFIGNPAANFATRVYVGDIHGRLWKFRTDAPGSNIRVQDFGVDQPIANSVALLNLNSDGSGAKPHVYVEMGNDRRVPTPPAVPPPPIFKLAGLRDEASDTDTATDNATLLFSFDLPDRFRGTVQPATAFNSADPTTARGRVFFAATRFNPVTATNCQSSFDSLIFAVGAGSGNAVYDLDMNNIIDSSDLSKQLTGKRVNAVTVAFGQVVVDQGLAAQNPPPPPAPPTTQPQTTATQVFLKSASGGGSPICR